MIAQDIANLITEIKAVRARWDALGKPAKVALGAAGTAAGLGGAAYIGGKVSDKYYNKKIDDEYNSQYKVRRLLHDVGVRREGDTGGALTFPREAKMDLIAKRDSIKKLGNDFESGPFKGEYSNSPAYLRYRNAKTHFGAFKKAASDYIINNKEPTI